MDKQTSPTEGSTDIAERVRLSECRTSQQIHNIENHLNQLQHQQNITNEKLLLCIIHVIRQHLHGALLQNDNVIMYLGTMYVFGVLVLFLKAGGIILILNLVPVNLV